jgi:uncharacterized membrane-anchored protein
MSKIDGVEPLVVASGPVRVGRRTKDLSKQLQPGEIAVIDHRDLDRVAADGLIDAGVAAVINVSESISGRYPNGGPIRVVASGIPLVDNCGPGVMERLADGERVLIGADGVISNGGPVGEGELLTVPLINERMEAAREAIGDELERFAVNTLEYIEKEARLIFAPLDLPPLKVRFDGRHALVVVRGLDYREDLRHLRPYIMEFHPVLIGVDGGADALLEMRLTPDIIIGDFDSLSERAWGCGAELVHHVHPDGRGPGREELQARGVEYHEFAVEGMSEDAAMLLAYENKAKLIVAVGTHASMVEFLDKGRAGMASTFLTRLRIGPMLVDAKGVSQLYAGRVRRRDIAVLIAAGLVAIIAVALASEELRLWLEGRWLSLRDLWYSFTGRF